MNADDLAAIKDVALIESLLPALRSQLDKQAKALETRVYGMLDKGELTPQEALNAWIEKRSLRRILSGFETKLRVGQAIGEKHAPILDKLG